MSAWPYKLAKGDPRHGTRNGYSNLGCRCESCRAVHSEAMRERRHPGFGGVLDYCECGTLKERRSETCRQCLLASVAATHGTESMYRLGCKCADCLDAQAAARRARRAANPEESRAYDREYKRARRAKAAA